MKYEGRWPKEPWVYLSSACLTSAQQWGKGSRSVITGVVSTGPWIPEPIRSHSRLLLLRSACTGRWTSPAILPPFNSAWVSISIWVCDILMVWKILRCCSWFSSSYLQWTLCSNRRYSSSEGPGMFNVSFCKNMLSSASFKNYDLCLWRHFGLPEKVGQVSPSIQTAWKYVTCNFSVLFQRYIT